MTNAAPSVSVRRYRDLIKALGHLAEEITAVAVGLCRQSPFAARKRDVRVRDGAAFFAAHEAHDDALAILGDRIVHRFRDRQDATLKIKQRRVVDGIRIRRIVPLALRPADLAGVREENRIPIEVADDLDVLEIAERIVEVLHERALRLLRHVVRGVVVQLSLVAGRCSFRPGEACFHDHDRAMIFLPEGFAERRDVLDALAQVERIVRTADDVIVHMVRRARIEERFIFITQTSQVKIPCTP